MMTVVAAIFLVVSIWLAVLLGPELSAWVWGPSLLALGVAVVAALPGLWQRERGAHGGLMALGAVVAAWFAWRAWASPVAELGLTDGLLLAGVVGCFVVMRAIQDRPVAERVLLWGLGLLVLASVVVVVRQVAEPQFTPGFVSRFKLPSGFFGHYNYGANFLLGASCVLGGAALAGRYHKIERLVWGVIAVAGMVAVYFTRSRGGICGAAAALGVFAVLALIVGKHQKARWFAPGIVAVPVIGLVVVGFLVKGWNDAQTVRNQAAGIDQLMDNSVRLHLIGLAVSCVAQHPWQGGGSRSFSWECYRNWEMDMYGPGGRRPEQVHNELLQAASDYGVIGAGLVCLLLGGVVVVAVMRSSFAEASGRLSNADAWRLGGVAGLAGMLIQSNFSFVFHMVPGALLLGVCLGRAAHPGEPVAKAAAKAPGAAILAVACGVACAALLVPMGWLGTRVTAVTWATKHGKHTADSAEPAIAAFTAAIRLWPLGEFYQERAELYQAQAAQAPQGSCDQAAVRRAVADYRAASACNPFAPGPVVNRANLLGLLGEDAEALQMFELAIKLQGGMEAGFKGGYSKAAYLRLKADRLLAEGRRDEALDVLLGARDVLVRACSFPSGAPLGEEARILRNGIGERLAVLLSWAGRDQEAEEEFASTTRLGIETGLRYLQACHLRVKAKRMWNQRRPGEALGLFLKARELVELTARCLPVGVSTADYAKLHADLDQSIAFLKGAKVEPIEVSGK